MTRIVAILLAACFVAPYLGAPDRIATGGTHDQASAFLDDGARGVWPHGQRIRVGMAGPVLGHGGRSLSALWTHEGTGPEVEGGLSADLAAVTRQGLVSWVDPKYGRFYLALPYPRGTRATICGAGGCITRTSTDYGPSQRIHPDRIADLSAVDFEYVCAVPRRFGLCNATLTILKRGGGPAPRAVPTAPATDQEGTE